MRNLSLTSLAAFLLVACTSTPQASRAALPASITVAEDAGFYRIAVPGINPAIEIPKQGRHVTMLGAFSARYFVLGDTSKNISISGWFESANKYSGLDQLWASGGGEHAIKYLVPIDSQFLKVGDWDVVAYDAALKPGEKFMEVCTRPGPGQCPGVHSVSSMDPVTSINAEMLSSGTWIELRVAGGTAETSNERRAQLIEALKSIVVR